VKFEDFEEIREKASVIFDRDHNRKKFAECQINIAVI